MSEGSEVSVAAEAGRIAVRKTYKLYVGGAFPRSESGRTFEVRDYAGGFLANAARASRKDARDAVVAARAKMDSVDASNKAKIEKLVGEFEGTSDAATRARVDRELTQLLFELD